MALISASIVQGGKAVEKTSSQPGLFEGATPLAEGATETWKQRKVRLQKERRQRQRLSPEWQKKQEEAQKAKEERIAKALEEKIEKEAKKQQWLEGADAREEARKAKKREDANKRYAPIKAQKKIEKEAKRQLAKEARWAKIESKQAEASQKRQEKQEKKKLETEAESEERHRQREEDAARRLAARQQPFLWDMGSLPLAHEVLRAAILGGDPHFRVKPEAWEDIKKFANEGETVSPRMQAAYNHPFARELVQRAASAGEYGLLYDMHLSGKLKLTFGEIFRHFRNREKPKAALLQALGGKEPGKEDYYANCLEELYLHYMRVEKSELDRRQGAEPHEHARRGRKPGTIKPKTLQAGKKQEKSRKPGRPAGSHTDILHQKKLPRVDNRSADEAVFGKQPKTVVLHSMKRMQPPKSTLPWDQEMDAWNDEDILDHIVARENGTADGKKHQAGKQAGSFDFDDTQLEVARACLRYVRENVRDLAKVNIRVAYKTALSQGSNMTQLEWSGGNPAGRPELKVLMSISSKTGHYEIAGKRTDFEFGSLENKGLEVFGSVIENISRAVVAGNKQ
ncbi:MAG: hypothetical protein WCY41_05270 [Candidatus Micrarchaeia archaeon]